jgi:hypothetical protein
MRAGVLRFLVGGFFTIFAPLLAFGEYLRTNKKTYLLAFLYMAGTIILQGQTRMIIAGLLVSLSLMLYFSKKLNFIKAMFLGGIMIIIFTWIVTIIVEKTFFGKLLPLTRQEIIKKEGSYGVRLKGYEYYMSKINESPFLGSGIWYDSYRGANPENVTHKGIYLSDLGITGFLFHFGFLGLIWMLLLFRKIYIALFKNITTVNRAIPYGILGYFIFGVSVMSTIDCFFSQGTILYFSLALAILSQAKNKA